MLPEPSTERLDEALQDHQSGRARQFDSVLATSPGGTPAALAASSQLSTGYGGEPRLVPPVSVSPCAGGAQHQIGVCPPDLSKVRASSGQ